VEPGIVSCPHYDEPFRVALPSGHPLTEQSVIRPDQVAAETLLLLGNGNCFRDQVVQACPHLSARGGLDGILEGGSLETVRHMVASGVGMSVVPASAAESWPQNSPLLQLRPFTDPAPFRRVVIAWRATYPRPQAIDVLRAAIQDALPLGVQAVL
jgi:LysR family hydrogen peroxide-inducible transcriptional activator